MDNDSSFLDATGPQQRGGIVGKISSVEQHFQLTARCSTCGYPYGSLDHTIKCSGPKKAAAKFEGGATRSHHAPEYEHLSKAAIERIISRMAYGATIHGPHNWRGGGQEFVNQCARHLMEHTLNLFAGDTTDDHLAAIGANFQMLAHFEAEGLKPTIFPSPRKANDPTRT